MPYLLVDKYMEYGSGVRQYHSGTGGRIRVWVRQTPTNITVYSLNLCHSQ